MKKLLAICLAVAMLLSLVGCAGSAADTTTAAADLGQIDATDINAAYGGYTFPTLGTVGNLYGEDEEEELVPVELEQLGYINGERNIQHEDLEYVMVYNPYMYDAKLIANETLSTGRIQDQIVVEMNRADGLEEEPDKIPVSQDQVSILEIPDGQEMDRATAMGREFKKGDKEAFYAFASDNTDFPRQQRTFTCVYSGQHCNIWALDNSVTLADAQACAEEFDNNIYPACVEEFATPRYDTRVNLLCYPMQKGIAGCFANADAFTQLEIDAFQYGGVGCNASVNMLHINSRNGITNPDAISTMAHEFQHMICFGSALVANRECGKWINETMSGYIEELLYPGIQYYAGRMDSLMESYMIRYGQSLYNFASNTESYFTWDVGVYGSVYLYSMYLERLAGKDVFSNFYDYWRNSYSMTLSDAEALANAVPKEVYDAVDQSVRYSTSILFNGFASKEEEWLSKLTLQFYLDLLDVDESDPADFRNLDPKALVYDQLTPASIEGGGRVILKVKGDSYEVPMLSGNGLIYVALDADFNVLGVYHG